MNRNQYIIFSLVLHPHQCIILFLYFPCGRANSIYSITVPWQCKIILPPSENKCLNFSKLVQSWDTYFGTEGVCFMLPVLHLWCLLQTAICLALLTCPFSECKEWNSEADRQANIAITLASTICSPHIFFAFHVLNHLTLSAWTNYAPQAARFLRSVATASELVTVALSDYN